MHHEFARRLERFLHMQQCQVRHPRGYEGHCSNVDMIAVPYAPFWEVRPTDIGKIANKGLYLLLYAYLNMEQECFAAQVPSTICPAQ